MSLRYFLRSAQPGASCPWVHVDFCNVRRHRFIREQTQRRLFAANAKRKFRRAGAAFFVALEKLFDDPVFKRVIADDHQPAAGVQQRQRAFEKFLQRAQFIIHRDTQRLKNPR